MQVAAEAQGWISVPLLQCLANVHTAKLWAMRRMKHRIVEDNLRPRGYSEGQEHLTASIGEFAT